MKDILVRDFMKKSIEVMKSSVQEKREDQKPSPYVGAVLVSPEGKLVDTAYRGELREGDHAEFTLIERKHRSDKLDGYILFATLEPCAPGARHFPKLACSERIVNARISKVYIGIEDPDPTVCRKGIQYLLDHGVEVEMYHKDLQQEIMDVNSLFLKAANERARLAEKNEKTVDIVLTQKENVEIHADMSDLNEGLLKDFLYKSGLNCQYMSPAFLHQMSQLRLLSIDKSTYKPTGIGVLLFGNNPSLLYPQAQIRCTYISNNRTEDIITINDPLLKQPQSLFDWYSTKIPSQIDRTAPERSYKYDYPIEVINELCKNAILHRDYDIEGAPIYLEINDDAIIIKSPGLPTPPLSMDSVKNFNAPSLSRNPQLMYVFDVMGLAEQRGFGFSTVRELRPKYNIPLPLVAYEEPYLVFTLPRNAKLGEKVGLSEQEQKGIDFIRLNGKVTRKDYESFFKIEKRKAIRELNKLIQKGYVRSVGDGRSVVYKINE